jgi:hypothetical protein
MAFLVDRRTAAVTLAREDVGTRLQADRWTQDAAAQEALVLQSAASLRRAELQLASEIDGVNTSVAMIQAELGSGLNCTNRSRQPR